VAKAVNFWAASRRAVPYLTVIMLFLPIKIKISFGLARRLTGGGKRAAAEVGSRGWLVGVEAGVDQSASDIFGICPKWD
jgi:hypothetical protein